MKKSKNGFQPYKILSDQVERGQYFCKTKIIKTSFLAFQYINSFIIQHQYIYGVKFNQTKG